ncbi:MAG: DoxX family protein [Gammaproteobacteria bacterium]
MRIVSVGHAMFAAMMIAIGILGLIHSEFAVIGGGVPKGMPARDVLAYLCAIISLACGIGLFWKRTATIAARVLLLYLLLWFMLFKLRFIILAPLVEGSYQSCGENAVVIAGAWVLYAWFATDWDKKHLGFATGDTGVRIARVFYGLALLAFGLSHYFYLNLTAPLIPGWLPWHMFWAYFTGAAYLAAGVAILIGVYARLAAVLSALQMGTFIFLVWVPIALAGNMSVFNWGELIATCILTAAAWVVADSYRGMRWLAVNKR